MKRSEKRKEITIRNNIPLKRFVQAIVFGVCGLWCLISGMEGGSWPRFYLDLLNFMGLALLVVGLVYFIVSVRELNASADD